MKTFYKLYTFAFFFVFSINLSFAQNEEDALRYAQNDISGSARFTGMSGAFSSLGGDLSAVSINPAGITTFTTNRISGSFSFFNNKNDSQYFNNLNSSQYSSFDDSFFDTNQLGMVWVYQSDVKDWNKIAIAFNYNKNADYGNLLAIKGVNTAGNSVVNYFLDNAQGIALKDLKVGTDESIGGVYQWLGENIGFDAQQAFLGYQAYIINPVDDTDDNNVDYLANANYTNVTHYNKIASRGFKSSSDISFGGTYKNKFQLGISLNFINIDYKENNIITETGYNSTSELQKLKFNNFLRVEGDGFQLKMGGIYKFDNKLRLSLAFHSPQWLEINEFLTQSVHTEFDGYSPVDISPNIENSFAPYKIITPSKIIVGISKVFGKNALISADYNYQNYSSLRFKEKNFDINSDYFDTVNQYMKNNFQGAHQLNIGGELKLSELSLRAGTFLSTSPYKSQTDIYSSTGYSLGAGYDFGGIILDAAWMQTKSKQYKSITALPDQAEVDLLKNKFVLGIRYNF